MLLNLIWIPFLTALIGWFTNWVAIWMLFRPRKPIRILCWRWQGLLPSRHKDIAKKVAELVERELLNQHVIRKELDKIDIKSHIDAYLHKLVHHHIGKKLLKIPILGSTINDTTLNLLEKLSSDAIHKEIKPMRERLANDLETHLQVKQLVETRILEFEIHDLERLVRDIANKELRAIELLGGVLGFVVGLIQVFILISLL